MSNITHGMHKTATYESWKRMIQRCCNSKNHSYSAYGSKGIKVCDRWRDFNNFYSDMGERLPGMTLDRIDVNGHYEPGNCRWSDQWTQQNNRRNNRKITFNGITLTVSEWSRKLGISENTLRSRIRQGWEVEKALSSVKLCKFKGLKTHT